MIAEAAAFAEMAHEGKFRKGSRVPYIYHPMETALLVSQMTDDEEVIAAAYLHDVLEDTSITPDELERAFGRRVLQLVQGVTEDKSKSWQERKDFTVESLKTADRDVKLIALADKTCNMRSTARDYLAMGDRVWERFRVKDKSRQGRYYGGLLESLSDLKDQPAYQEMERWYRFVFEGKSR